MKKGKLRVMSVSAILAVLMAAGCTAATQQSISDTELSYRNVPLTTEKDVAPPPVEFPKEAPGTSKKFARAFENAPPMIPHSVDGILPITKDNNSCLGCHMPEVAKDVKATPIPPTHFMDFRTQKPLGHLAEQRYNCSQCHAPQAKVQPLVKNNFAPEFRSAKAKERSNLLDVLNEGVQ
ncbi:nitrate reductase cytochrome c-type subunit [Nitrosophilus alvini]|uniref:nitrate reductase cytochrome c-type subunit n=1 Tax=Nitrosophilus alvini TaxID=2714855 RepID=UPI00190C0A08|nr:nitrate reductase cytochrome c-type subunit [Nitrosophilus alvini]